MKKVYVDQNQCIGCELCTKICKGFQMNAQDKSEFVLEQIEGLEDQIQDAIDNCPAQCIHWQKA
ncbi:MAG: ferredoxin [Candidatus Brocadiae bacterium]|nr:ferredoxin [Candidatus Brocadiia bacterium]